MHNEELHNFYVSPSIIRVIKSRRIRWAEHVARIGRWTYIKFLSENLKTMGRPWDMGVWEDNIRTDFKEIGWKCVDWIHLT